MFKITLVALLSGTIFMQAQNLKATRFNDVETNLIQSGNTTTPMRVLQTTNQEDYIFLTQATQEIKMSDKNLKLLAQRMLATVLDPKSKGVGIAAPQVGVARKAFWVKRMDKEGQPFEFFVNPKITWYSDVKRYGKEGCLSIPNQSGLVYRSLVIQIEYFDLDGKAHNEVIEGYTAVICQHEYDHLEGILYPDQIERSDRIEYVKSDSKNDLFYEL
jgi:peptide deformylase